LEALTAFLDIYIQMDGEDFIEEELTNIELVDPILDIDDQPPPIVNLSDARHHTSMLSHFIC
jgi:hypothetical protein